MNYTHLARYKNRNLSQDALEEIPGLEQSLGLEIENTGSELFVKSYSRHAIHTLSDMLEASPYNIKVHQPKKPCVFLGRSDMLIPTVFSIMPIFDCITFHAESDGMYAYGTKQDLLRVFGSLPIIDESLPNDEIMV